MFKKLDYSYHYHCHYQCGDDVSFLTFVSSVTSFIFWCIFFLW